MVPSPSNYLYLEGLYIIKVEASDSPTLKITKNPRRYAQSISFTTLRI